jgi:hypothetical protein
MKHPRLLLVCSALLLSLILTVGLHATLAHRSAPNSTTEDLQEKPTDTDTGTTENGSVAPPLAPAQDGASPYALAVGGTTIPLQRYLLKTESYDPETQRWERTEIMTAADMFEQLSEAQRAALPVIDSLEDLSVILPDDAGITSQLYRRISGIHASQSWACPMTFSQLSSMLAEYPYSGEYDIILQVLDRDNYVESEDKYEKSHYAVFFRYSHTPPVPQKPIEPLQTVTFTSEHSEQLLLWIGDSFIVPDPYPIWSESNGLCVDFVSDVPSLIRSGELNVDKLPCLRAGENMTVSLPGNTTYKGYVIYRYVDRAYVLQRDLPNDLNQALSDLTREEWLIGLEFQTRDANSAHGWRAYFRYVVE